MSKSSPTDLADPIVEALTARATDLSRSIVNPATLARKLHESLAEIAGDAATAYHIGLVYDGKQIKAQIAYLGPHLIAKLAGNKSSIDLGVAYERTTDNGWKIAVGLTAEKSFKPPKGSGLVASFAVTITK